MPCSAAQYVKFEDERTRPVRDLVAHIPNEAVTRAADIGCGPGNSTEVLKERYPKASIVGLDSSPEMIAAARKRRPGVAFELAEIEGWREEGFDFILANAVLQWIPRHGDAAPGVHRQAREGRLAHSSDLGQSRRAVASAHAQNRGRRPLGGEARQRSAKREARRGADWCFRLLRARCAHVDYGAHRFPSARARAVVERVKGAGLRPYLEPLDPPERES